MFHFWNSNNDPEDTKNKGKSLENTNVDTIFEQSVSDKELELEYWLHQVDLNAEKERFSGVLENDELQYQS